MLLGKPQLLGKPLPVRYMAEQQHRALSKRSSSKGAWLRRRGSLHLAKGSTTVAERTGEDCAGTQQRAGSFGVSKHQLRELTDNRSENEKDKVKDACLAASSFPTPRIVQVHADLSC